MGGSCGIYGAMVEAVTNLLGKSEVKRKFGDTRNTRVTSIWAQ
jgi:hypothetical protein